jgi:hypothetical protein
VKLKAGSTVTGLWHALWQVTAWHRSGGWHHASVVEVLADGRLKIEWADGDEVLSRVR